MKKTKIEIYFRNNNCDNNNNDNHKLYILAWDKICMPKCEGGRSIRRTSDMNTANLAKQG